MFFEGIEKYETRYFYNGFQYKKIKRFHMVMNLNMFLHCDYMLQLGNDKLENKKLI